MNVCELAEKYEAHAIEIRRDLHRHPELGNQEFHTAEVIRRELTSYGIEIQDLPGLPTAVTAVIYGGKPGKTVGIRADIDALPVTEQTGLPFASEEEGKSHACGHDMHTSIVLLTARILQEMRDELCGNVRLIFQHAEEKASGAVDMMKAGFMDLEPKCDSVIGVHTSPEWNAGTIGVIKGAANASSDTLSIVVKGIGGHGAHPYRCVDPIVTSAYMLTQLQTVVSRENPAVQPAVLTFGMIHGGHAMNVIPNEVRLDGTLRAFNTEGRYKMHDAIRRIAECSCAAMRAEADVQFHEGINVLINDADTIDAICKAASETIGSENINQIPAPSPGSDDFAEFSSRIPGAQFRVGTGTDDPMTRWGIHNPQNIFSEKAIITAAKVMAQYAVDFLA